MLLAVHGQWSGGAERFWGMQQYVLVTARPHAVLAGHPNPVRLQEVQASPALEDAGCGDELRPALFELVRDADHGGGVVVHSVENHP